MLHDHLKYNYENSRILLQSVECSELYDENDASSTFQSSEWWECWVEKAKMVSAQSGIGEWSVLEDEWRLSDY
jgi:hypothetical protein